MVALHVSVPLSQLADEISFLLREAIMLKQDISAHFLRPLIQVALNLLGRSRDPCVLTSDVMDESEAFTFARETKTSALYVLLCALKLKLCYLFGRIDEAERLSTLMDKECNTESFSSLALGNLYLYQGLTALAGKSSRRRAVRLARGKLKKLKFIARLNPITFQSQVLIVEGEIAAVKDEVFRAVRLFDEAAECARKDRVMGEIALAHERAAFALLRGACARTTANEYFEKARAAYSAWGADAKVEQIKRALITDST
jgi:histidine kinase